MLRIAAVITFIVVLILSFNYSKSNVRLHFGVSAETSQMWAANKRSDPYNKLYEGMRFYHSLLRNKWVLIRQELNTETPRPQRVVPQFLDFTQHLDLHHRIEEAHIFPLLAKRLPQFADNAAHKKEHEVMHKCLTDLEGYARYVQDDMSSWSLSKAKVLVDRLEGALFPHLEAEEESLKAESLRKAGFTVEELRRFQM